MNLKKTLYFLEIGLSLLFLLQFSLQNASADTVDKMVQTLAEVDPNLDDAVTVLIPALTDGNLKIVYGAIYSPIVDQLSKGKGVEELINREEVAKKSSKTVLKTTFVRIKGPFRFVTTAQHDFVIIPTLSKFNLDESQTQTIAHLLSTSYIMAVRDHGTQKWQFVYDYVMSGDPVNHTDPRKQFFPDLPTTVLLPEKETKFVNN